MPLEGVNIIRPFYPGGDYQKEEYPEGSVVIDNPPFSILAEIHRFYLSRNIPYFLFVPALTPGSLKSFGITLIVTGVGIIYENGANVSTSFATNMVKDGTAVWVAGDLNKKIVACQKSSRPSLPKYNYPANVETAARIQKIAQGGVSLKIARDSIHVVSALDSQRKEGKYIFGAGWLLSEKAAAEKAAAEKAAAEKAAARGAICWPLSEREKEIIKKLK